MTAAAAEPRGGTDVLDDVVLEAVDISKTYGVTRALKGVNFKVRRGKVTVLFGENGAGKSTLMKIMSGVEKPTGGQLILDGEPVELLSTSDAVERGISIIHQELNLAPNLSVRDNIFIGRELKTRAGTVDYARERDVTVDLMQRLEEVIRPSTLVQDLRVGQQQIIEIARALAADARILIMDEPTSALSASEVEVLFKVIRDLTANGVAIVYISHHLEEAIEIADYAVVFRDGDLVATEEAANIDLPWVVRQMVGREADYDFRQESRDYGEVALSIQGVTVAEPDSGRVVVNNVSLDVREGEIVCLYGLMGAGRTELMEALSGRDEIAGGRVLLGPEDLAGRPIADRIAMGVGLVPEDRQRDGLIQMMSVGRNMSLASLLTTVKNQFIRGKAERDNITREIADVRVKTAGPGALITSLSGGNQQKVVIGKMLLTDPKVLLLDEPTRGIDVGAKGEIFALLFREAKRGLAVLYVTSEVGEALTASHRIVVMSKGRMVKEFDPRTATRDEIMAASGEQESAEPHGTPPPRPTPEPPPYDRTPAYDGTQPRSRRPAVTTTTAAPSAKAPGRSLNVNSILVEGRALIALILIIAIFAVLSDNYLSTGNLTTITKQVAFNAIVALGMLLVILNGGIDLSVGSTVGLAGAVAGNLFRGVQIPFTDTTMFPSVWVVVIISIGIGALVGLANGLLIAKLNLAPFIVTLGMLYVARGLTEVSLNGQNITNELSGQEGLGNTGFFSVFASRPLGLPISAWVMILFAVVMSVLLSRTPFGRWLYATGSNERAAQLSGVPVKRVQIRIYVISGLCAGVVGILQVANISSSTADLGTFYELNAIAAVVIGGAALSGGRGTVRGTIIGAFVIGFLANGLVIVGVSPFWQKVITGAVIILAVAVDQIQQIIQRRRLARRAAANARVGRTPPTPVGAGTPT